MYIVKLRLWQAESALRVFSTKFFVFLSIFMYSRYCISQFRGDAVQIYLDFYSGFSFGQVSKRRFISQCHAITWQMLNPHDQILGDRWHITRFFCARGGPKLHRTIKYSEAAYDQEWRWDFKATPSSIQFSS